MLNCSEENKKKLRKEKLGSLAADNARNTLVQGVVGNGLSGAYIQFGQDLRTYNVWEALLYAEGYEKDGHYRPGSAQKALDAAIEAINNPEEE